MALRDILCQPPRSSISCRQIFTSNFRSICGARDAIRGSIIDAVTRELGRRCRQSHGTQGRILEHSAGAHPGDYQVVTLRELSSAQQTVGDQCARARNKSDARLYVWTSPTLLGPILAPALSAWFARLAANGP